MSDINDIGKQMTGGFSGFGIKDKILNGIKKAQEMGIKLVNGEWGNKQEGAACALGCMLLANDIPIDDQAENEIKAAEFLGVDSKWVSGFIYGFDDEHLQEGPTDAFNLGTELREQFLPASKVDEEEEDLEEDDEE